MGKSHLKRYKGTYTEYINLHNRVKRILPKRGQCSLCNKETIKLDLANVSQNYLEKKTDWMWLCQPCHRRFDSPKYQFSDGEWHKLCTNCFIWKCCKTGFYQRKSTIEKNGKVYPRTDFTSWCRQCTLIKIG